MWRGIVVLAVTAALSGCSGDDVVAAGPLTRATLGTTDQELPTDCPPIAVKRLARQAIAFSGVLSMEGPDGIDWVFDVDHWYTGGDEDVIVVRGNDVSITYFESTVESHPADEPLGPVRDGDRLLVAGPAGSAGAAWPRERTGLASACLTEKWTPDLAAKFDEAFPTWSPRPVKNR